MSDEKPTPDLAVAMLRAKGHELEDLVKGDYESNSQYPTHLRSARDTDLTAATAMVCLLLADHIERVELRHVLIARDPGPWDRPDDPDATLMEAARESNRQIARAQEQRLLDQMRVDDD